MTSSAYHQHVETEYHDREHKNSNYIKQPSRVASHLSCTARDVTLKICSAEHPYLK